MKENYYLSAKGTNKNMIIHEAIKKYCKNNENRYYRIEDAHKYVSEILPNIQIPSWLSAKKMMRNEWNLRYKSASWRPTKNNK